jgi:hypothetical protein
VIKLGKPPSQFHVREPGFFGHLFVSFVAAANDSIAASRLIQIVDQSAGKETGIGQKTDPGPGDGRGDFFQAAFDEVSGSGIRTGISGPQRAVPELLPVSFETEDRVIRRSAFGFRFLISKSH